MANRQLQPDYIKWVLELNASQAQAEYEKLSKANKELAAQSRASRKAMSELEKQGKKGSQEWKNLSKSISDNRKAMDENQAKMDQLVKQIKLDDMTLGQLEKRLKDLKKQFKDTSKATSAKEYKELQKEIDRTQQAIYKAKGQTDKLKNSFLSLNKTKEILTGFFLQIGASIMGLITGAFRSMFTLVVDFEKANSRLAAVLGTSKDGIKDLTAAARELGATTSYTAAEVTGLQIELAKLGFSKDQIKDMEAGVLKFAKAVDTDLASASAFAGAALRIFGKDAKDTEDVLATFAVATTKTALDFSKLEASLSTVGPVANAFGLSVEDTTALLGQLANAGFDASSAATATRNIILNLCDANGDLAKALGGPVKNADDLAKGLQKLNAEGVDLARALELTDKRSVAAFETFLKSADQLTTLRDSITGVKNELTGMSGTMADNVAGAMAGLQSAAQELVLKISEGTEGPIKDLINGLTWLVRKLGDVIQWMSKFSGIIKVVGTALLAYKGTLLLTTTAMKAWNLITQIATGLMNAWKAAMATASAVMNGLKASTVGATTATKGLSATLKSIPWTAIIASVVALVAAISSLGNEEEKNIKQHKAITDAYKKEEEELEKANAAIDTHKQAREDFTLKLAAEKSKLIELQRIAENENIEKERRLKAIAQLNKICPTYEGHLDKEGRKLKANKKALAEYVVLMEKRMRLAYYKDEYEKYLKEDEAAKLREQRAKKELDATKDLPMQMSKETITYSRLGGLISWDEDHFIAKDDPRKTAAEIEYTNAVNARTDTSLNLINLKAEMAENGVSLEDFLEVVNVTQDTIEDVVDTSTDLAGGISGIGAAAHNTVDEIKRLKDELKQLRQIEPVNQEHYDWIKDKKKSIEDRLKALKAEPDDAVDREIAKALDEHQLKMLEINKSKTSEKWSEIKDTIAREKETVRYNAALIASLAKLREDTDKKDLDTIGKINVEINKAMANGIKAQQELNTINNKQLADNYEKRVAAAQAYYDTQEVTMQEAVAEQKTTQEAADIYLMAKQHELHETQLKELQDYKSNVEAAESMSAEQRQALLLDLADKIRKAQSQVLTDTGKWSELMREMTTNAASPEGLKQRLDMEVSSVAKQYDTMIGLARQAGLDTEALEQEKKRRIMALNYQYQEQMWKLKENVGLSWADQYRHELDDLDNMHTQGLISEKGYQKKRLDLAVAYGKKQFDFYTGLGASMFTELQNAEIAQSEAKYDMLIQQAKNNNEDTAELEQEKENKKLEIQKKYADVNFAVKISQIIADTAVSIMKAFAELGPIGGAIAAAMLTATGAAQVMSAKAERDKIKNMQPGKVASGESTKPAVAERVLTGYAEGGYTGDGDRYEVAGLVHRGEYVVPKPIMSDRRVIDAVGTIESIRRSHRPRASYREDLPGYAEGGMVGVPATIDVDKFCQAVDRFEASAANLKAYVVLRDFDYARDQQDRARAPFTRPKK